MKMSGKFSLWIWLSVVDDLSMKWELLKIQLFFFLFFKKGRFCKVTRSESRMENLDGHLKMTDCWMRRDFCLSIVYLRPYVPRPPDKYCKDILACRKRKIHPTWFIEINIDIPTWSIIKSIWNEFYEMFGFKCRLVGSTLYRPVLVS